MKLRLRSLESNVTHRIEVPNTCNLQQLEEILNLQLFPSSTSSASVHQSLLFSLNRKDELCGSSPQETLQSMGVTSGDLIYFTQNPFAFSSQIPNFFPAQIVNSSQNNIRIDQEVSFGNNQMVESGKVGDFNVSSDEGRDLGGAQMNETSKLSNPNCEISDLGDAQKVNFGEKDDVVGSSGRNDELVNAHVEGMSKLSDSNDHNGNSVDVQMIESGNSDGNYASNDRAGELMGSQMEGSSGVNDPDKKSVEGTDGMEVDDEAVVSNVKTRFSVPGFLKKVFAKEVGDGTTNRGDHKLLVIAVHAVLLESGFVGYDPVSGRKVDGFHLADEWPSSAFGISLHYTLPEVSSSEVVETVVVKFQSLGRYVNVYGSFSRKGFRVYRVCLNESRFVPSLNYVWKNRDNGYGEKEMNGSMKLYPNQEIFEFWKTVKDGLSYPLLIELCEHVGFLPPPCLMRLPTELKLKILESLPAVDVARVACASSELRFVASNNDLWRLKYEEEFGDASDSRKECQWKAKFDTAWEIRKKRKRVCEPLRWIEPPHFRPFFPGRRGVWIPQHPGRLGNPFIIGGDYDGLPAIPQHPGQRFFRMNCYLGGSGV